MVIQMSIQSCSGGREVALLGALAADQIYSFDEFSKMAGISTMTLRRLIRAGEGPIVTKLSARRGGIRGRHGSAWLDSRAATPEAA